MLDYECFTIFRTVRKWTTVRFWTLSSGFFIPNPPPFTLFPLPENLRLFFYLLPQKKAPPPVTGKGTILRKIENRCV